jgi:hypothetical protein
MFVPVHIQGPKERRERPETRAGNVLLGSTSSANIREC